MNEWNTGIGRFVLGLLVGSVTMGFFLLGSVMKSGWLIALACVIWLYTVGRVFEAERRSQR
jgi:hypothetical protein